MIELSCDNCGNTTWIDDWFREHGWNGSPGLPCTICNHCVKTDEKGVCDAFEEFVVGYSDDKGNY